jgi:hypothetical protein
MNKLPPSGKTVQVAGSDCFQSTHGEITSVQEYFHRSDMPRQLDLDVFVQPSQTGPFKFGVSPMVQTDGPDELMVFTINRLEAHADESPQQVREGSHASVIDMLKMEGVYGVITAKIRHRMVTNTAWDNAEASRRVMRAGAHTKTQKMVVDISQNSFATV